MIAVFVTFRYESGFDAEVIHKIAEDARARFEGMPGLLYKVFAVDTERREARNVYVWETVEAAKAFFTEELTHRATGLYGVRPTVEYAEVAALVANAGKKA
jgi:heme-degrading monooxygenase HmoA